MLLQLPGATPATRLSPSKKDITSHLLHPAASSCTQQLPPASPRTSQSLCAETSAGTMFPQTNFLLHLKFPASHLTAPRPPGLLIGLNFVARQGAAEPRERCPSGMQLCVGVFF